jgi:hypothetical protein
MRIEDDYVGDMCLVDVMVRGESLFILGSVYIHPNVSQTSIEVFLFQMLCKYSDSIRNIVPNMSPDTNVPIMLTGDFNVDVTQNK